MRGGGIPGAYGGSGSQAKCSSAAGSPSRQKGSRTLLLKVSKSAGRREGDRESSLGMGSQPSKAFKPVVSFTQWLLWWEVSAVEKDPMLPLCMAWRADRHQSATWEKPRVWNWDTLRLWEWEKPLSLICYSPGVREALGGSDERRDQVLACSKVPGFIRKVLEESLIPVSIFIYS